MTGRVVISKVLWAIAFSGIALLGTYRWTPLTGAGLILHGLFDLVHPHIVSNAGVPGWWPLFHIGVDSALGVSVICLSYTGRITPRTWNNPQHLQHRCSRSLGGHREKLYFG